MAINLWDQEYNDINMFKILHASADYFLCSFEFENLETGEQVFADYFDDPLYELLTKFNLDYDGELVGKEIEAVPADLFIRPEEFEAIKAMVEEKLAQTEDKQKLQDIIDVCESNIADAKENEQEQENLDDEEEQN